jgi:peptidoglycan hydrolase-like protein with peptidoglycan-binding domain
MATLPAEDQMSEADRREVQKMLQGMKYYQGPIDGKFGPLTRAAIRRYQDSIGVNSTCYLTAEEATRLASTR